MIQDFVYLPCDAKVPNHLWGTRVPIHEANKYLTRDEIRGYLNFGTPILLLRNMLNQMRFQGVVNFVGRLYGKFEIEFTNPNDERLFNSLIG
jgi:hypothetical protein